MVAASVLCADTDEEARWLAGPSALTMLQLRTGRLGPVVTPEEAAAYPYTDHERAIVEAATADHAIGGPMPCTGAGGPGRAHRGRRAHGLHPGPLVRGLARSLTLVAQRWGSGAAAASSVGSAQTPAASGSTSAPSSARWSRSARSSTWR